MWLARWAAACGVLVALAGAALAQPAMVAPFGPDSPAAWARLQIADGKRADFDLVCRRVAKIVAPDPCRTVTAAWLQDVMLGRQDAARRVDLANAIIDGDVDLRDAEIPREVSIEDSRFSGAVDLSRARFASRLSLKGSTLAGPLDGSGLHVGGDLMLESAVLSQLKLNEADIKGPVSIASGSVAQDISMPNASIGADLNLFDARVHDIDGSGMQVNGRIFAKALHADGNLMFGDAITRGDVWFEKSETGPVSLDSAHIGSTLHMIGAAVFHGPFTLDGANVDHYVDIVGAHFEGGLSAQAVHVGQEAKITAMTVRGPFSLNDARLDGNLSINLSRIRGSFDGSGLTVRGRMNLAGTTFDHVFALDSAKIAGMLVAEGTVWNGLASLRLVHVEQDLDLSGATLPGLDLSGATIDGMLQFSPVVAQIRRARTCWVGKPAAVPVCGAPGSWVRLLNAHAGAVEAAFNAWPARLELSGFTYTRINSAQGEPDTPGQAAAAWDAWLRRDPHYSAQHYLQLATARAADGDRDGALAIQYRGRERERYSACASHVLTCVFLTSLSWIAGYGIGDYTWRAIYWVIGLTLVGAACVWWVRRRQSRNVLWPLGASLERLLPYVRLDRQFTEFFEQQSGFRLWHKLVFGLLALMGSVLGLFLAAAASGLTQRG